MAMRESKARLGFNAMGYANRIAVRLGFILLILTALSLITMPVTQHLWTWDHFLHGGQDFETSALMILTALNLVLVLAKRCKQNVGRPLTRQNRFSKVITARMSVWTLTEALKTALEHRTSIPDLPAYQLPLLI